MALERPTIREHGLRHTFEVANVVSAEGCVLEDMPEGAGMIHEHQVIEELGVLREDPAYRSGWEDGRFGPAWLFVENPNRSWDRPDGRQTGSGRHDRRRDR